MLTLAGNLPGKRRTHPEESTREHPLFKALNHSQHFFKSIWKEKKNFGVNIQKPIDKQNSPHWFMNFRYNQREIQRISK